MGVSVVVVVLDGSGRRRRKKKRRISGFCDEFLGFEMIMRGRLIKFDKRYLVGTKADVICLHGRLRGLIINKYKCKISSMTSGRPF